MTLFSKLSNRKRRKVSLCSAVIAAAGSSNRMGEDKLFIDIHGIPVLAHTLMAFQKSPDVSEIIVVTRPDCVDKVNEICQRFSIGKATNFIFGGATRMLSVLNGVNSASDESDIIAIHDGARPCIELPTIQRTIELARKFHAAAPAIPVTSTLKKVKKDFILETVDRSSLYEVQTPQVFQADLIKAALTNALNKSIEVTDECKAVELIGATVRITEGSRRNIKLTTPEDIVIAKAILQA